jgi:hypothetical protein
MLVEKLCTIRNLVHIGNVFEKKMVKYKLFKEYILITLCKRIKKLQNETHSIGFEILTEVVMKSGRLHSCYLGYFLALFTLGPSICSPKTSAEFQRTTQRYIPEDSTLQTYW